MKKKPLPLSSERFSSSSFFFFLHQMNTLVWTPCCEWPELTARRNSPPPPSLVVLVIIATRHGRHQIWPISGPGVRSFSQLFLQIIPQVLQLTLQLEGAPWWCGGPMHLHCPLIARNGSAPEQHRATEHGKSIHPPLNFSTSCHVLTTNVNVFCSFWAFLFKGVSV